MRKASSQGASSMRPKSYRRKSEISPALSMGEVFDIEKSESYHLRRTARPCWLPRGPGNHPAQFSRGRRL